MKNFDKDDGIIDSLFGRCIIHKTKIINTFHFNWSFNPTQFISNLQGVFQPSKGQSCGRKRTLCVKLFQLSLACISVQFPFQFYCFFLFRMLWSSACIWVCDEQRPTTDDASYVILTSKLIIYVFIFKFACYPYLKHRRSSYRMKGAILLKLF